MTHTLPTINSSQTITDDDGDDDIYLTPIENAMYSDDLSWSEYSDNDKEEVSQRIPISNMLNITYDQVPNQDDSITSSTHIKDPNKFSVVNS